MRASCVGFLWLLSAVLAATPTVEVAAPEGPGHLPAPVNLAEGDIPRPKVPELRSDLERWTWDLVIKYSERYDIEEKAPLLFGVIRKESACRAEAVSPCGRYHGLCQFKKATFDLAVRRMKRLGLFDENAVLTPMDPDHAVHVMAWMWSQGDQRQWGPVRRFLRKLARERQVTSRSKRPSAS